MSSLRRAGSLRVSFFALSLRLQEYLYLRVTPKSPPDAVAKGFVHLALSQEGQREVARTIAKA